MSLIRSTRIAIKHLRRFVAGFISVPTFAIGKIRGYPFSKDQFAIEQDKYEIKLDRDLATFKSKQNEK